MNQTMNQAQNIALDSCVVIDIMEKPKVVSGLKACLRGKSVKIILCDVVLDTHEIDGIEGEILEKLKERFEGEK